jgi:hypothetical protein
MNKSYLKIGLVTFFILLFFSANGQIRSGTISLGWELGVNSNSWNSPQYNPSSFNLTSQKEVHYFYKENRALVAGLYAHHRNSKSFGHSGSLPSTLTYLNRSMALGGYLGKRNHYAINDQFHFFLGFGAIYVRESRNSETLFEPEFAEYNLETQTRSFSMMGYGNFGLLYLINRNFSIETKLFEGQINYSRPISDTPWSEHRTETWRFDLHGLMDQVSVAVRYYF